MDIPHSAVSLYKYNLFYLLLLGYCNPVSTQSEFILPFSGTEEQDDISADICSESRKKNYSQRLNKGFNS